jgi:hypothetical protein
LILNDLIEVLYAPRKAFKRVIANPKYLGAFIVLLLFLGLQVGYVFGQFSKIELEQTQPISGLIQTFTNATSWTAASNVNLTNNFNDYYNNTVFIANLMRSPTDPLAYYPLFGNFSLQMDAIDSNTLSATLFNTTNVDCGENGFQNLTLNAKLVQPQSAPQNATLTLYSLSDSNYFTYDLTSDLVDASAINQWGNLTIPLGPDAKDWRETGNPQWNNITALSLQFDYPDSQNITIRIGALFFRGLYVTPLEYNSVGIFAQFLQVYTLQFLFTWLLLSGLIYLFCKALKGAVLWKPLFIAMGFALMVMVIRAAINIIATATIPVVYYPFDVSFGTLFDPLGALYYPANAVPALLQQSQASIAAIDASLVAFRGIITAMFVASYIWLVAMGTFAIKALNSEPSPISSTEPPTSPTVETAVQEPKSKFSTIKCVLISAASVGITLIVLWILIGVV